WVFCGSDSCFTSWGSLASPHLATTANATEHAQVGLKQGEQALRAMLVHVTTYVFLEESSGMAERSYWIPGSYVTSNSISAPSNALPRWRTLCTNSKKPRYSGSFSWEIPRCGRSQLRNSDQNPSIVFTCTSQTPSPSSSRANSPRPWLTCL